METWAEPINAGTWRLDARRSRDAIERGQVIDDFANFLRKGSENPLPKPVEDFLDTTKSNATAVQNLGEAFLYNCRDSQTAGLILSKKSLKNLCHRCGEAQIVVPAGHLAKFQKQVHALGLGIV